jgi:class 3 adenylate cyclase
MAGEIREWLEGIGLAKYAKAFAENEIDFEVLRHLGEGDLRELGLPMGPRKKLLAAIAELDAPAPAPIPVDAHTREGERRQLTVMIVDLVGSTELSGCLDPEEMHEVLRRYQDAVTGAVARYQGHVAKFMGDGVIVYFGYPKAHEDEAERSVRAGLNIVDGIAALEPAAGAPLACRIGIATGQVVVGHLIGEGAAQEEAVTGETPNLAARLQGIAEPGQVVVSQATRNLLGKLFEAEDLGPQSLKGFQDEVGAWRILSEQAVESRFEAVRGETMTQLVGRKQELALLLDRWERTKDRDGQAILLSGEAGVGKSHLARALYQALTDENHTLLRYQCSPHHTNSVLHPFIAHLARAARFAEADSAEAKLDKLEALLRMAINDVSQVAPLFAALLSIPAGDRYRALDLGAQQQMQRTQQALLSQLTGLAGHRPVLVVFEDAHWADPTTLDVLGQMLDRVQDTRGLVIVTYRPDFQPPWSALAHITMLSLNRLSRREAAAIVADLTGGKAIPEAVLNHIIEKTDGVPLFIEELTKTVLESGMLEEGNDEFILNGPLQPLAIPSTLHDSLIARLDNLPSGKELAQTGAVIGREFSHRLLSVVSPLSRDQLEQELDQLIDAELLFRRGAPPDAMYVFKHALVRDVAYETLLKNRRVALHARILDALKHGFPHLLETEPELLAYHAIRAKNYLVAVDFWLRAGRKAASSSANVEAVSHLRDGLNLLHKIPEDEVRDRIELSYLSALGPALMATCGWDATEVDQTYSRARVLARKTDQAAVLFPAVWGLWLVAHAGGAAVRAGELLAELLDLARVTGDDDLMLQGHHAGGSDLCSRGAFEQAQHHIDAGIGLYRAENHADQALHYGGHDPCICAHSLGALTKLMMGYPDTAERYSQSALDLVRRVDHRPSVAHAGLYRAELCHLLGRPIEAEERARQVVEIAEQFGLAHYAVWGQMLIGWSRSAQGETDYGLDLLERGLVDLRNVGIRYHLAHRLALRVDVLIARGAVEEGVSAAEECLTVVEDTGERWFEPEALRLLAVAKAHGQAANPSDVRALLWRSLEVAEELDARFWKLRTANSLARQLRKAGQIHDARELLTPIYNWFTEGFDTPDLKSAKMLLNELN